MKNRELSQNQYALSRFSLSRRISLRGKKLLKCNVFIAGFTLLEVLIAITVLAISLSGIYFLLRSNIYTTEYSSNKVKLMESGTEIVYRLYSKEIIEPTPFPLSLNGYNDITYSIKKRPLPISNINEYSISVKKDATELEYIFYK